MDATTTMHTNNPNGSESLLPRFAAASEWLAEHHPDAPRLPGWVVVDQGVMYMWYADETVIHDPACLSGAVVWAMEVDRWAWVEHGILVEGNPRHDESKGVYGISILETTCNVLGRNPENIVWNTDDSESLGRDG